MKPSSNQPVMLYGTAKTHKFEEINNITKDTLKFRPIIAQTGTCYYNTAQVIGQYLKPLCAENNFIITNTQDFASMIKEQPPLQDNEEYVSYDVESLFTNVPINETIDHILDMIYVHKKLPEICTRLVMKRLLRKLTTEGVFMFQSQFYKQTDGCTMGGPLSVIFSNIYLTKLENDIVVPMKPLFYRRFVDDVINKRRKNTPDLLLDKLNSYHPRIKFTIEVNPTRFLDTKVINKHGFITTSVHRKVTKLPTHWSSKIPQTL